MGPVEVSAVEGFGVGSVLVWNCSGLKCLEMSGISVWG